MRLGLQHGIGICHAGKRLLGKQIQQFLIFLLDQQALGQQRHDLGKCETQ